MTSQLVHNCNKLWKHEVCEVHVTGTHLPLANNYQHFIEVFFIQVTWRSAWKSIPSKSRGLLVSAQCRCADVPKYFPGYHIAAQHFLIPKGLPRVTLKASVRVFWVTWGCVQGASPGPTQGAFNAPDYSQTFYNCIMYLQWWTWKANHNLFLKRAGLLTWLGWSCMFQASRGLWWQTEFHQKHTFLTSWWT